MSTLQNANPFEELPPEMLEAIADHAGASKGMLNFIQRQCQFKASTYDDIVLENIKGDHPNVLKFLKVDFNSKEIKDLLFEYNAINTLMAIDIPLEARHTCVAAHRGNLEYLKYLHTHGCPWDEKTCVWASKGGYLDCLKYSRENGCPWDIWTCARTSKGGYLDCLKYARVSLNCAI